MAAATPLWHKANGYAILILIVFRLLWGFFGGSTSRFRAFVAGPTAFFSYAAAIASGRKRRFLGHSPLGGWMILTLMAALAGQAILGLYSADQDRLIIEGPLAKTVSDAAVDRAAHYHHLGFELILVLAAVHIAANLFYDLVQKDGLIRAMITGRKPPDAYADQAEAKPGRPAIALLCFFVATVVVLGGIVALGGNLLH